MKPTTKKYIIAGSLAVVSVALMAAYLQYKKLMNYVIKVRSVKVKSVSISNINLDLLLNFINKSSVTFTIKNQKYDVYINGSLAAKLKNDVPVLITKESENPLLINVSINPKSVFDKNKINAADFLINQDKIIIKVDIKLQVKIWLLTFNIPYVYEESLKGMLSKKE